MNILVIEDEITAALAKAENRDRKPRRARLLYAADGKTVEVEEAVAPGALPQAVMKSIEKAYPGGKIVKAEDLFKDGQKLFEIVIQANGKKQEVTIDPSGKIVK